MFYIYILKKLEEVVTEMKNHGVTSIDCNVQIHWWQQLNPCSEQVNVACSLGEGRVSFPLKRKMQKVINVFEAKFKLSEGSSIVIWSKRRQKDFAVSWFWTFNSSFLFLWLESNVLPASGSSYFTLRMLYLTTSTAGRHQQFSSKEI